MARKAPKPKSTRGLPAGLAAYWAKKGVPGGAKKGGAKRRGRKRGKKK